MKMVMLIYYLYTHSLIDLLAYSCAGLNKLKEFVPKDGNGEMSTDLKALLVSLYGNSAMVALKLNNYRDALQASSQVLKYDAVNVKSLYRRAVAYNNLGYYDDAKVSILLRTHSYIY